MERRLSRRRFFRTVSVTALGALAASVIGRIPHLQGTPKVTPRRHRTPLWSDPRTWGGRVPREEDLVVVSKAIILDVNAHVREIHIRRKGKLIFDPRHSVTLISRRNVVVRGRLTMRPERHSVVHTLRFPDVDERRFLGGGVEVIPSDVGLWITGRGVLDVAGSPKLPWTRCQGTIPAGSTSIALTQDPVGWRVGDEVALTPTLPPSDPNFAAAYDIGSIAAVDRVARRIVLRSPTKFHHPAVDVGTGTQLTAEILNLTRNVRIEGTPAGRSHIWIQSSRPQHIGNASVRYTGPRRPRSDPNLPGSTEPVPGRYGLHFHLMESASQGTSVMGFVVRDSGSHAFVAHQSHGLTFRDCIAHNTFEDAYWWDPSPDPYTKPAPPTDNVLYERCVASMVRSDPPWFGLRLAGFFLGARSGNVIRNCVAVGVQGTADSCGFIWPETSGGLWTFEDCIAHNNTLNGIFVWQNNHLPHVINRFTAYHNGRSGIKHGAYVNGFRYQDSFLYANGYAAIEEHALSLNSPLHTFSRVRCDQGGLSSYCVVTSPHLGAPEAPVQFIESRFRGFKEAAFGFLDTGSPFPNLFSIVDCTFEGNEFWVGPSVHAESRVRVLDPVHGGLTLRRADQPGVFRPEWNASISPIG